MDLVSTGSRADTGQFGARFLATSRDGGKAFFATREQLVSADTNGSLDVYMRQGGNTTLISTGPTGRSGGVRLGDANSDPVPSLDLTFSYARRGSGVTPDGEHVFFVTDAPLVDGDTDTNLDVYQRSGGHTALISTGTTARCAALSGCDAHFATASADGARVVFVTGEGLAPEDTDSMCPDFEPAVVVCTDVYERSFGTTKQVSLGSLGGSGGPPGGDGSLAYFEGASADGTRIFFRTSETLEPEDTDTQCDTDPLYGGECDDVYERSSGTTKLVSPGGILGYVSENGRRLFFRRDFFVLSEWGGYLDWDLDEHSVTGTTPIHHGLNTNDVRRITFTPDGTRVFFDTLAPLTAEDTDGQHDVYRSVRGTTTLISVGAPGDGARPAHLGGTSRDGSRVFFETEERLSTADTDDYRDVYQRSGSTTTLLSGSGEFGPGASFLGASADGARVFFKTKESLSPADLDSSEDIYESSDGEISFLSRGGAPSPADFGIELAGLSDDGEDAYFLSDERLVAADQDDVTDLYVARTGTGPSPSSTAPSSASSPSATPPPPVTTLTLGLGVESRYRLRALLRGLVVPVRCSVACTAGLRLKLAQRSARRLGLVSAKDIVLSRRTVQVAGGKSKRVRLRLSKRSVRRLKKARTLRLKLEVAATDAGGHTMSATRRIVARR